MSDLSERLRHARLGAGLSVQQIAARTKIQAWMIESMDAGKFAKLPGGIFIRSYLAAYAREVALDPAAIVAEYVASQQPKPEPAPAPHYAGAPPARRGARVLGCARMSPLAAAGAALALAALLLPRYGGLPLTEKAVATGGTDRSLPAALEDDAVGPAAPPVTMLGGQEPAASAATLHVELRATAPLWLEVTSDGRASGRRMLNAGGAESHSARESIRIRTGDAGALVYSINGAAGRPLGGASQVREVVVTPDNYRSFLASPAGTSGEWRRLR
jgi:hypothetical protein